MSATEFGRPVEILLVEDNPGDIRLTTRALRDSTVPSRVSVTEDGEQALALLRRQGRYAGAARPDLILLDLSLPKKDGREVLAELKADDDLRGIPVVVLTASASEEDVCRSHDLSANSYVAKPGDVGQFLRVVRSIRDFWLTVVRLPPA